MPFIFPSALAKPYEARQAINIWNTVIGTTSITEFQNLSRYDGLFSSTVKYWLKLTISGISLILTFFDIYAFAPESVVENTIP